MNHVLFLSNNSQEQIIDNFINQCFIMSLNNNDINDNTFVISWKKMHYIWKIYLSTIYIPNMIYSNNLKEILKIKLNYKDENDVFINITSKYLPQISNFLQFWESYIQVINLELDTNINNEKEDFNEYELDELITLFKSIYKTNINEEDILKIIKHFYSQNVVVNENKYIKNIKCSLWDKCYDINLALMHYKDNLKNKPDNFIDCSDCSHYLITFDELYHQYNSFCNANMYVNKVNSLIVSKHYFERYIKVFLNDYIQFEKFIDYNWIYN
jgi:hypothetical protein